MKYSTTSPGDEIEEIQILHFSYNYEKITFTLIVLVIVSIFKNIWSIFRKLELHKNVQNEISQTLRFYYCLYKTTFF